MKHLFLTCLSTLIVPCYAADPQVPPNIGTAYLKLSFNNEKNGIYDHVLSKALNDAGYSATYDTQPLPRVLTVFKKGQLDCIAPYSERMLNHFWHDEDKPSLLYSTPFHKVDFVAYYKNPSLSKFPWEINQTKGLRLGIPPSTNKMNVMSYFGVTSDKVIGTKNIMMMIEQLHKGRSEVIVYAHPMPLYLSDKLGLGALYYKKDDIIMSDEVSVACYDTPENSRFIHVLNEQLNTLWKNGFIKETLGEVYGDHVPTPRILRNK